MSYALATWLPAGGGVQANCNTQIRKVQAYGSGDEHTLRLPHSHTTVAHSAPGEGTGPPRCGSEA